MDEKPTFPYKLLPELAELGSSRELTGLLPLNRLDKRSQVFELASGISYTLSLSNTGGAVLLNGRARANATTECARCLETAVFTIEGDVEGYYLLNPGKPDESQYGDEVTPVGPDGIIDLSIPIVAALVYEMPQVILCREDCAGLCPICGANRNETPCTCVDKPVPDNPFAVLGELFEG